MDISKVKITYDLTKSKYVNQKSVSVEFNNLLYSSRKFGELLGLISNDVSNIAFTDTLKISQGANPWSGTAAASTWKQGDTIYVYLNPARKMVTQYGATESIGELLLHEFSHHHPEIHSISNFERLELATIEFENKLRVSLGLPKLEAVIRQSEGVSSADKPKFFFGDMENCFHSSTMILMDGGHYKRIKEVEIGDYVLAFDQKSASGRGELVPRKVVNTFTGETKEWVAIKGSGFHHTEFTLVTPGHHFLSEAGEFMAIEDVIKQGRRLVAQDGKLLVAEASRVIRAEQDLPFSSDYEEDWQTYNFEVEDLHTYVANGIIPICIDHDPYAHLRRPIVIMCHG
jgi:hypothetical protein